MIECVYAENFKGQTFEQPLSDRMFFTGPNGSGKTARMQALVLAVHGFVPGVCVQLPGSVLKMFAGEQQSLTVGVVFQNQVYERRYAHINGRDSMIGKIGNEELLPRDFDRAVSATLPSVFNLTGFMALSDPDKLKLLTALFPQGNAEQYTLRIDAAKREISALRSDIRARYKVIDSIRRQQAEKTRPPGTVAENRKKVSEMMKELESAAVDLEMAKQAAAKTREECRNAQKSAKGQQGTDAQAVTEEISPKTCMETVQKVVSFIDTLDIVPCGFDCPARKEILTWK